MNGPAKIFASLPGELKLILTVAAAFAVSARLYCILTDDVESFPMGIVLWTSIGFALCYTMLKSLFRVFAGMNISVLAVSVPALMLAWLFGKMELAGALPGMMALPVYILWLIFTLVPRKYHLEALICLAADAVMVFDFFYKDISHDLTVRIVYAALFVLTAYHIRMIIGLKDSRPYPFEGFLIILAALLLIPSRNDPINWRPVIDAGQRIADKTVNMIWSAAYYLEDLGLGSSYHTGYSSLAQTGDHIRSSEKTEIELKTRDNTTFSYIDENSGKKLKRRRVVYLTGGSKVEHEQMLDILFSLYSHNVSPEQALLFARNAVLDIDYVYLKTGDEIMPEGTVRLRDGRGNPVTGDSREKHRKGYSLHAEYMDLDHGSPYLESVIASPVKSVKKTSVSYKQMYLYAYNTLGLRLNELVSEDEFAAWQGGSRTMEEYLDVSGTTDRMRDLAGEITKESPGIYEKCRAVEDYLRQYKYRTDVVSIRGADTGSTEGMSRMADGFLFDTGKGYCVHFASSMVMLLRLNGIPARLCSGYRYVFPFDRQETYEVKAECAHAWPEAYIDGFGWVPFEPTTVMSTAAQRSWRRHPEKAAAGQAGSYFTPVENIRVPEPVNIADIEVPDLEETEDESIRNILKIGLIIAAAALLMVIILIAGTAAFRAARYGMAGPVRKLELDIADITGTIRSAAGITFEDRGIMSDYEPYIPDRFRSGTDRAFDILNRVRYRHAEGNEEKVTDEETAEVRELRNSIYKEYKRRFVIFGRRRDVQGTDR